MVIKGGGGGKSTQPSSRHHMPIGLLTEETSKKTQSPPPLWMDRLVDVRCAESDVKESPNKWLWLRMSLCSFFFHEPVLKHVFH